MYKYILGFLLLISIPALGKDTISPGVQAYNSGKYSEAAKLFEKDVGNAEAQYYLGILYMSGTGVEKDTNKALRLWQQAAKQKYPQAMAAMGSFFLEHRTANAPSVSESFWMIEQAAILGDKESRKMMNMLRMLAVPGSSQLHHNIERKKLTEQLEIKGLDKSIAAARKMGSSRVGVARVNQIYESTCAACHNIGVLGSPRPGTPGDWKKRLQQGKEALYRHAINGFNTMPPRGGDNSLTDEEIIAVVEYMIR